MNAAERRSILNSYPTAKLIWRGILILEGIYLVILVGGLVLGSSVIKVLIDNLHVQGAPVAIITVGYIFAGIIYFLFPVLFFIATFQLDKWVRWLLWINVPFTLPSIFTSVQGFAGGFIAIIIVIGYQYVLRQVYSKTSPTLPPPSVPTTGTEQTTQTSAVKNKSVNKIIIGAIVLVVIGFGFTAYSMISKWPSITSNISEQINSVVQGDAKRNIANVHIPLAIDPGIFIGKLEQFDFKPTDLPSEYGPYTLDRRGNGYYKDPKVLLANDKDAQQFYNSGLLNNVDGQRRVIAEVQVATFTTTYGSSLYYAVGKKNNDEQETDKITFSTFTSIPYEHYVGKDTGTWPDSTRWPVVILNSNAIFFLNLTVPTTATPAQVEGIVQLWLKNVESYNPGTKAVVEEENANGQTIGGSQ